MDVIIILIIIILLYFIQRRNWSDRLAATNQYNLHRSNSNYLDVLFATHLFLFVVYYTYASLTASDAYNYYYVSSNTTNWFDTWGMDSQFIVFLAWPFTHLLGLSFEATMLLFAYIGFNGVMLFYLAAKENVFGLKPLLGSYTLTECLFLLPNIHFWSSSLGKGSLMLFGISLLVFGLARYNVRKHYIILGGLLIYFIRPHILFAFVLGVGGAMLLSRRGVKPGVKFSLIIISIILMYLMSGGLVEYAGDENLNIFQSDAITKRANDLSRKAGSGVDITNYNQIQKLFTFWYRPLFFDAPGVLGIIVSFENLLYVLFTVQILRRGFVNFKHWNGWFRMLLFAFLFASLALAQVMGNLGIAMRQKAQIMPLFFIVYLRVMSLRQERKEKNTAAIRTFKTEL